MSEDYTVTAMMKGPWKYIDFKFKVLLKEGGGLLHEHGPICNRIYGNIYLKQKTKAF